MFFEVENLDKIYLATVRDMDWNIVYREAVTKTNAMAEMKRLATLPGFNPRATYDISFDGPFESKLIAQNEFSKMYTGLPILNWEMVKQSGKTWIICNETRAMYRNQQEASRCNNIAPSNMSNHLKGIGSPRLKGLTFRYAESHEIEYFLRNQDENARLREQKYLTQAS